MVSVKHIAVIGSGLMGSGIAHVSAQAGFKVSLYDINQEQLEKAKRTIEINLNKGVEINKITEDTKRKALENIHLTTDLAEATKGVDFVIEAVPEKLDLKIDVFKKLDELTEQHVILATNTSTMSSTEIGAATNRPEQTIAMHFFNPVHKMKLVEIIKGLDTSEETLIITKQIAEKMGKETVTVNEFPGFVTSRMNSLIGNEAMNMLVEGVASAEDIDKAMKLGLNHPMGPLELADLVGLDTRLRNMEYLHKTLGEKYRPSPILIKYVKAGRLGRKSGRGFYEYNENN